MKKYIFTAVLCIVFTALTAQEKYVPTAENLANRTAFQDDKFGLFVHWGFYSMLADGEWALQMKKVSQEEYAKLASGFYPSRFSAAEWVSAVKDAGMKYIVITSRHHDGFSMWGTKQSPYNIVDATPFKRDVLKELADECQKQGIKLGFYYSQVDWGRPDYNPLGSTGRFTGRKLTGTWNDYLAFMDAQLTELLTEYGPVHAIWFDGWWDKHDADWQLERTYHLIHKLQPGCLVGGNHHQMPFDGEDFQMFERDLPGQNHSGFQPDAHIGGLPLETCETMNGSWGYNITDTTYKSSTALIQYVVKAAGNNANLLLNVGPQPNGEIPAAALSRMKEVGAWLRENGQTIYGTRGGPVAQHDWGVTTARGNKVYVHIMKLDDAALFLPLKSAKVKKAVEFKSRKAVKFSQDADGVLLRLPARPQGVDYIVELEM